MPARRAILDGRVAAPKNEQQTPEGGPIQKSLRGVWQGERHG
jgi:hypothetical protein